MAAIRRYLVAAAALMVAASGLVLGGTGPAYACSCVQTSLASLAKNADAVFVGTVDAQRTEGGERIYSLRVSDVYSGSPGQTTTVRTDASDAACGMSMRVHRQYMVVGKQPELHGEVSVTSCSGTQPISDRAIATVERALGPATPYRGVPDQQGPQRGDKQQGTPGDNGSDAKGDGQAQDDTAADASEEPQDESSTSQVAVGVLLALAVGGAFLLPRLRRHHRDRDSAEEE